MSMKGENETEYMHCAQKAEETALELAYSRTRASRPDKLNELTKDIEMYHQLLDRGDELAADIPPNRNRRYPKRKAATTSVIKKPKPPPKMVKVKQEPGLLSVPLRKSSRLRKAAAAAASQKKQEVAEPDSEKQDKKDAPKVPVTVKKELAAAKIKKAKPRTRNHASKNYFEELNRLFTSLKPKYQYKKKTPEQSEKTHNEATKNISSKHTTHTFKTQAKYHEPKQSFDFPPSLTLSRAQKLFEDHVQVSKSYLELIEQVKNGFQNNLIDISATHNFIYKDLEKEKSNFTIEVASNMSLPVGNEFFFTPFDMDLFFNRSLQGHEFKKVPLV